MRRLLILSLLAGLTAVKGAPPLPRQPHKSAAVHQGAGAAKLVARLPKLVIAPSSVRLDWDYTGDTSGVVFNVRCLKGPLVGSSTSWTIVSSVSSNSCVLPFDYAAGVVLFRVSASNTLTHLENL